MKATWSEQSNIENIWLLRESQALLSETQYICWGLKEMALKWAAAAAADKVSYCDWFRME